MSFLGHTLYDDMGHEAGNTNIEWEWADEDQPENEYANEESEAAVAAIFSVGCVARESCELV